MRRLRNLAHLPQTANVCPSDESSPTILQKLRKGTEKFPMQNEVKLKTLHHLQGFYI
jgi:hypothetical protein